MLGFARDLKAAHMWPPSRIKRPRTDAPVATPYIVIPMNPHDLGDRSLPSTNALHSAGVEVLDPAGNAVIYPVAGTAYVLRASIRNLGAAACYAGVVEFAVADPVVIDTAANGSGSVPVFAIEGFVAEPGATVTITSRRSWKPATAAEASGSIVVHAYDALLDPPTRRFDAGADRHVGRRDSAEDFAGTWDGWLLSSGHGGGPGGYGYHVVVTQTGAVVSASIHRGYRNALMTGRGSIANGQLQLAIKGLIDGVPPAPYTDDITLSLSAPNTLHAAITSREIGKILPEINVEWSWVADLQRAP